MAWCTNFSALKNWKPFASPRMVKRWVTKDVAYMDMWSLDDETASLQDHASSLGHFILKGAVESIGDTPSKRYAIHSFDLSSQWPGFSDNPGRYQEIFLLLLDSKHALHEISLPCVGTLGKLLASGGEGSVILSSSKDSWNGDGGEKHFGRLFVLVMHKTQRSTMRRWWLWALVTHFRRKCAEVED